LPFFSSPDYISSTPPTGNSDTAIDLVLDQFIETEVLQVLNRLQTSKNYTSADVETYSAVLQNEALGIFAQAKWN
jgi:hypothetical protein